MQKSGKSFQKALEKSCKLIDSRSRTESLFSLVNWRFSYSIKALSFGHEWKSSKLTNTTRLNSNALDFRLWRTFRAFQIAYSLNLLTFYCWCFQLRKFPQGIEFKAEKTSGAYLAPTYLILKTSEKFLWNTKSD